ncbi:MAG: hypothetical protein GC204_06925 [Chloroflexi bacterium]|nr:hypothetical protein [Chloroflexota bacterium]
MYLPAIKNARPVYRYQIGSYVAVIVKDCESFGKIRYNFVLYVLDPVSNEPIFAVTSEKNNATGNLIPSIGVFPGSTHENLGMSEDWADLDKFTSRALEVVTERFQINSRPQLLPISDPHPQ